MKTKTIQQSRSTAAPSGAGVCARRIAMLTLAIMTWGTTPTFSQAPPNQGGPGGPPGPGRFGGMGQQKSKLVSQFDKDGDKRLNAEERKAAFEFLQKQGSNRGPGGRFGRRGGESVATKPGVKLSPSDVKAYPEAEVYDLKVIRTIFLEFTDADWEKEMAAFKNTDIEMPAKFMVDGKTFKEVGVRFRGMSSFGMVGEGQKRSLNINLDYTDPAQSLKGVRTLNLLNSHEDPSFMRGVLYSEVAREYLPAAKANFVRVVINGESWGLYVNSEQFNKDFTKEWFGSAKGARWKVPGSPGGRGSLAYLGDDPSAYKRIYSIKTKDNEKSWKDLIHLCKVLNDTPPEKLEAALAPILNVDGALKFLALENVLINNDGYWIRTSDYNIYEDTKGKFHILPSDTNETFSKPGGPGFGGGGPRGGGPGGRGMGFGPGGFLSREMFEQADKDHDEKLTKAELSALAGTWFQGIDEHKNGRLSLELFTAGWQKFNPMPGPPGGGEPGGFNPATEIAKALFKTFDVSKDGVLDAAEMKSSFESLHARADKDHTGALDEGKLRAGLTEALAEAGFQSPELRGGPGGGPGGPRFGGPGGGPGGPGGGMRINGVELDPLAMAKDENKVLLYRLLAVPALRTRYLTLVGEIATKWLDWNKLGPIAEGLHKLIAEDVAVDTRKLETTEDFEKSVTGDPRTAIGIKAFAEQRRSYLLKHPEVKKTL